MKRYFFNKYFLINLTDKTIKLFLNNHKNDQNKKVITLNYLKKLQATKRPPKNSLKNLIYQCVN